MEEMAWSADSGTYELDLSMSLPVFNPNFLPVRLHGDLQVMFYTSTAGSTKLEAVVPSRSLPYNETVHVNAGRLDQRFLWTVLNQV